MNRPQFRCNDRTGAAWHSCPACGATLPIPFPTTALDWLSKLKAFAAAHAKCKPR